MKREIKFRAFITSTGKMVDCYKTTPLAIQPDLKCDGVFVPFREEWPIMQYTGLKDKNGKEIYEGDIMQFLTERRHGFQEDGKIVILPPVQFGKFNPRNDTLYEFIGFHIDEGSISYKLKYGCEVIGNIYENPELL